MTTLLTVLWTFVLCTAAGAAGGVRVSELTAEGRIKGEEFRYKVSFTATASRVGAEMLLAAGDTALAEPVGGDGWRVRYDPGVKGYVLSILAGASPVRVEASFLARSRTDPADPYWREASVTLPAAGVRRVEVSADRRDMELKLPGTLQAQREETVSGVRTHGILQPGTPFAVRWKAHAETVEVELLVASKANTIITLSPGALRMDGLFVYEISQGTLQQVRFAVPRTLNVTQVRGQHLRDWQMEKGDDGNTLVVKLSREQEREYRVQVLAEMPLAPFPTELEVPVVQPLDGTRADGELAIGTNSAIQLQVKQSAGLSQVDAAAFSRATLEPKQARAIPQGKAFFYGFAATPYQMSLALDDIVPSFDADERLLVGVEDDEVVVKGQVELEIRDAPIRRLSVTLPAGFVVALVEGGQVSDHSVREPGEGESVRTLVVEFKEPVQGRALVQFQLELGRSPLGAVLALGGFSLPEARNERGFIVVSADRGVLIGEPQASGLRQVHTRSVPMRVADAEFAWRFRERGWTLGIPVEERPASIRAEAFHLLSLGDGVAYGSVALTYVIAGAPVDELQLRVSERLKDLEFVGMDVSRWFKDGEVWRVKLRRKVLGDYNLGLTSSQRYEDGGSVLVGGVSCERVETQTGSITVASHLSLQLSETKADASLIPIGQEETPADYRLLSSAPILRSYKYVSLPHELELGVRAYSRGTTPPVIVEFVNAQTSLSLDEEANAESVTRVRYTVKNSSAQFLDLQVPADVRVWGTYLIEKGGQGGDRRVRASASQDAGVLKIPLRRRRNPNDPLTVEVEYGQVHGRLGWAGGLELGLPLCNVRATYADWRVDAPKGWAVRVGGDGTMAGSGDRRTSLVPALFGRLTSAWGEAFGDAVPLVVSGVVVLLLLVAVFLRRVWVTAPVLALALGLLFWQGGRAYAAVGAWHGAGPQTSVFFSQVLDLDTERPLTVEAHLVPDWREYVGATYSAVFAVACVVALAGAARARRLRPLLLGAAVTGVLMLAAQFRVGCLVAAHVFTWGIPLLLFLGVFGRLLLRTLRSGVRPAAAAVVLCVAALFLPSSAQARPAAKAASSVPVLAIQGEGTVVRALTCRLDVQEDCVAADLSLDIVSEEGGLVPLAASSVLLLSAEDGPGARFIVDGGRHVLELAAGRHEVEVQLLYPLSPKAEDQQQSLRLPLPPSLTCRVELSIPQIDLAVEIPEAIHLGIEERDGRTRVAAVLPAHRDLAATWKPRGRRTELEKTVFYAEVTSLARAESGLVEGYHLVGLRVAQGEAARIEVEVPEEMTVTLVDGERLGSWRFDPASHRLHVAFDQPLRDDYELFIHTQIAATGMPYTARVGALGVVGASRQRGVIGLVSGPAVAVSVSAQPQAMNIEDYLRAAGPLLKRMQEVGGDVLHAYRMSAPDVSVTVEVAAVTAELRVSENGSFSVADERLVYNGVLEVSIAKAGLFSVDLELPRGYDIDDLTCEGLSHWDDTEVAGTRLARLHFQGRITGGAAVNLALSQVVSELPTTIEVPRIGVSGALKHRGQLVVSAERGVRLSVAEREGVSELDVAEVKMRDKPALAFRLLRPDWSLRLQSEVLEPRVSADFLHLAEVTDGLVRHRQFLRYRLQNAGVKVLQVQVPQGVLGLLFTGPEIARKEEMEAGTGRWRIELSGKWFDRPYPLQATYETRFDQESGAVPIQPVRALDADLQRGSVVVRTSPRVEITESMTGPSLQKADARAVPSVFGAGELSDAAFCYTSATPDYELVLKASRHGGANLLQAEILGVEITSVVNRQRDSIHQVALTLRAGEKRHLYATLPAGARVWSLLVDRQSKPPAFAQRSGEADALLIPLPQSGGGDLSVAVDLIYVLPRERDGAPGAHSYRGPRFDLPLRNITWRFYVPEGYRYSDFEGTLTLDEEMVRGVQVSRYDIEAYEDDNRRLNNADLQKAVQLQQQGLMLAREGNQKGARQALEQAFNYSQSDKSLNEDARVNLRKLLKQQAVVGLVGRRGDVKREAAGERPQPMLGERFTQEQAERLQSSLSKPDSENLELITSRIIEIQEAAAGVAIQLMVKPPLHGRVLSFRRPLQVDPSSDLRVSFRASPKMVWAHGRTAGWALGVLLLLSVLMAVPGQVIRAWDCMHRPRAAGVSSAADQAPVAPEAGSDSDTDSDTDSDGDTERNVTGEGQ